MWEQEISWKGAWPRAGATRNTQRVAPCDFWEVCWGTLMFWVCNLGIMFHNTDSCIDFSLAPAAGCEQMAPRNLEVVAKQWSERRVSSLPSPAHFLFRFCWARGSSAPTPLPSYPEVMDVGFCPFLSFF